MMSSRVCQSTDRSRGSPDDGAVFASACTEDLERDRQPLPWRKQFASTLYRLHIPSQTLPAPDRRGLSSPAGDQTALGDRKQELRAR
jgi:hypothetical protein